MEAIPEAFLVVGMRECSSCQMNGANGDNEKRKKKIRAWRRKAKEAHALLEATRELDKEFRHPLLPFLKKRKTFVGRCIR